jgi:hypothetical protein
MSNIHKESQRAKPRLEKYWANPLNRAYHSAIASEIHSTPERKAARSEQSKQMWKNSEYRDKMKTSITEKWNKVRNAGCTNFTQYKEMRRAGCETWQEYQEFLASLGVTHL